VGEIVTSLKPRLKTTNLEIEVNCNDGVTINSYPGAISQILTNLIVNSITHGYEPGDEGRIKIDLDMYGASLMIVYADDGQGMAENDRRQIFEPFFTTKRGRGGSGLGMSIVYNLVTLKLNGTVECESAPGDGTRFTIKIPIGS
jgi:signal transduction histidine kinase